MNRVPLALSVVAMSFCAATHGESLRCDGDLVQIGDSKAAVLLKCGAPFFVESLCLRGDQLFRIPAPRDGVVEYPQWCELVDEWSYNPGFGQFITILRFHGGALITIRYGDRVR